MRALAQPEVLRAATIAALASSVASYPRLSQWSTRIYPLWYLEALLFLGGIVLWAFVFAWHTKYTQRRVFTLNLGLAPLGLATFSGILLGLLLHLFVDPALRARTPEDYPATVEQWLAMTLFSLAFTQLYLVFSPFAWLIRLFRRPEPAAVLTVLFGVFVMAIKNYRSPAPLPPSLSAELLLVRLVVSAGSVYLFWRGGVGLVWWWGLLLQSRYLLKLDGL